MLAKHTRLTAAEVREILKSGRSARFGSLSAKYKAISPAKAAVVVSSKVAKSAVSRNRLRRKAYAILKEALPKGVQSVFFLHKPAFDSIELIELCSKLSS